MRELLIFALALALTSTANAALTLYLDGSPAPDSIELTVDEVLTIQIYDDSTTQAAYVGYIMRDVGGVGGLYNLVDLWSPAHIAVPFPDIVDPDDGQGFELMVTFDDYGQWPGIHFEVNYSSSVVGSATISLYDGRVGYSMVDSLDVTVVPEPTTLALLTLGGLALLKKRRR
jgi:hypothetical protein